MITWRLVKGEGRGTGHDHAVELVSGEQERKGQGQNLLIADPTSNRCASPTHTHSYTLRQTFASVFLNGSPLHGDWSSSILEPGHI